MKKIILTLCILIISSTFYSQIVYKKEIDSKIESVVVYLTGAEITRKVKVNLKQGRNLFIFKNLSPSIYRKSIRVKTDDKISLLSITSKINYLSKVKEQPRIKRIKDSLEIIEIKIQSLKDEYDAYKSEKKLLLKNMSLGGANNGVSISELKQAADYYRARLIIINKKVSSIRRKKTSLRNLKSKLKKELRELNAEINYRRNEVSILLSSNKIHSTTLELKYIINKTAGWSPIYDIRAIDIDKPVDIIYRANVFNNSKIDWENVNIKLSTANPFKSIDKPELKPWYLNFRKIQLGYLNQNQQLQGRTQNRLNFAPSSAGEKKKRKRKKIQKVKFTEIEVAELNAEFTIKAKYSIPANSKPYLVNVNKYHLNAKYKHYAVSRLDKDVFLLARITGWEDLNLIEGPANIYYRGTYLGMSHIYTRSVDDTLNLSLGRDNKVIVTRVKLKDYSSKQFIGSKIKETYVFELTAKNNRKSAIEIDLLDQVPISKTEDIEVKVLEISNAEHEVTTGELKWRLKLQANETKKLKFSFYIKYPKNKKYSVRTKQKRKAYMPKF